ncbi:DUF6624 domain-containing protein [Cloacibacterium normanense]|uniref:DUF6624 domain-containing protein n=1 Tax=Cloacibacterium normanense TaxID=237258 RepID=UPI00352CCE21
MRGLKFIICLNILLGCKSNISSVEKDNTLRDIENMFLIDQIAAYVPEGKYSLYTPEQWQKFKDSVFFHNTIKAEIIFNKYGYPGIDFLGHEGETKFWAIVQHSDENITFQKKVLKSLQKEVKSKNAKPEHYALLYDRIQINKNKKQLFGTQVNYNDSGQAFPKNGIEDSLNIDCLRKKYNLEKYKTYLNKMTERHFEMNMEYYKNKNILKPKLYN